MNRRASEEQKTSQVPRQDQGGDGSKDVLEEGKEQARETVRQAADVGKQHLESGAGRAAEGVGDFAEAVGTAASRLSELEHEGLADYANRMASYLSDMSSRLRDKNVDEVVDDVRRIAERNPALFILGSVAVGLGLSRFAKASRDRQSLDGVGGDVEWSGRASANEFTSEPSSELSGDFPSEPSMADYSSRKQNSADQSADRPTTPDSSGGGGL